MDASGRTRHSASHPLFQRDAPPLASSQRLIASQQNAPLQQSQRERIAPQPLVTSPREGVAPLQQPLVPPQQLRPVSHQDVPPLISSSRRDAPSMNQARGRSRSRSRPPAPISRDPKPWSSLFKAPVGSPDLRLDFFAPEVQADQKIAVYEAIDSDELIETWSMAIVGYVVGLRTSFFPLSSYIRTRWGISTFDLHMLETGFFVCRLYSEEDLQRVLEGFWTIRGHPMILRRWAPDVRLELDSLQSIPIWVSFHGLPLHLWGRRFIAKLCSTLGQPLYLDKATASQTRLTFARACVMVSSDEELPNDVSYRDLDGSTRKVKVSYSWKPQRCKSQDSIGFSCAVSEIQNTGLSRLISP
ncbi:hypothetical protein OPV22_032555 [Ensete ventricosum]|uniref:DUF4283 domain-containing protein n=1 Tax=Ensete ventricosum TaxID=4639 RepID=A0AAV8PZL3_ENSVE|nr:hypothetical protein OPV22_032555 [Ensete ventricosum]